MIIVMIMIMIKNKEIIQFHTYTAAKYHPAIFVLCML